MSHIIQCRLCKERFDTNKEEYVLIGQKAYYHKKCYDDWVKNKNNAKTSNEENFWKESVIDYLYRDVKIPINFAKLENQWANFIKPSKKMTPKGIYFAVKYYYDVKHGNKDKAADGIGIVPYIYQEAAQYWTDLEVKKQGTIESIIEQIKSRESRPVQYFTPKETKKEKKTKWNLEDF